MPFTTRNIAFLTLIFVLSSVNFLSGQEDTTQQPSAPAPAVFSPDDSARALQRLASQLDAILSNGALSKFGVAIYSVDAKKTIYAKKSAEPVTPASVTKLFTTFTAFHTMGGDTAYVRTRVYSDAPIEDGVINGNLYIAGQGDPFLSVNDIEALADQVSKAGVRKITGTIYADNSFFDNITDRAIYSGDHEVVQPMPPVIALGMNRNTVTVLVSSASTPGVPLRVQTIPRSDAFTITLNAVPVSDGSENNLNEQQQPEQQGEVEPAEAKAPVPIQKKIIAKPKAVIRKKAVARKAPAKKAPVKKPVTKKTVKPKAPVKKKRAELLPEDDWQNRLGDYYMVQRRRAAAPRRQARRRAPRVAPLRVSSEFISATGVQHFNVVGSLAANRTVSYNFNIVKPDLAVAGTLRKRLNAGGITVSGGFGVKGHPEGSRLLAEFTRPLSTVVRPTNKHSDNFLAEHLFKMIGGSAGGSQNTAQKASETVLQTLKQLNISDAGLCKLNDGSGLSRRNLVTANAIAGLLIHATTLPFGKDFESSLAIAGVDGTLKRRMRGTDAEGKLRAKTGTLRNVSALAGYVPTRDGEKIAFALVFNGPSVGFYKSVENQICTALASFSYR